MRRRSRAVGLEDAIENNVLPISFFLSVSLQSDSVFHDLIVRLIKMDVNAFWAQTEEKRISLSEEKRLFAETS